jgi:type I restriction enzyme S subunit
MSEDGRLPPGWCFTTLGELSESCLNGFGKRKQQRGMPTVVLRLADIHEGMISFVANRRVNALKEEIEKYKLRHDDLVAIRVNGSPGLVGRLIRFTGAEEPILYCDHFIRVRVVEPSLSSFLRYYGDTQTARRYVDEHKVSTAGQNTISQGTLENLRVPLPPLREQQRIADAIDELLSDLDAGVAALGRVQRKLAHYRAAVLKAAVEGALTAEWRRQHPATEPASALLTRILAERRRRWEEEQLRKFAGAGREPPKNWKTKYKEPVAPDATDLPPLAEGWCWVSLDQIADIAGGVTKGQKFSPTDATRIVPYLRVANVQRGFLDLTEMKNIRALETDIDALRLQNGDVLFTEGGDRDKLGRGWVWEGKIAECVHQNHVFRARMLLGDIQPKFVSWCGNSYGQRWFMRTGKQSVNLASINLTVLRSFPVPLAPAGEQEAIVETVEDQLSVIDHIEADLETKLQTAQALRQSILRHAFTGQLVPQDPNDVPASELLKRIAAEREERARQAAAARGRRSGLATRRSRALRSAHVRPARD